MAAIKVYTLGNHGNVPPLVGRAIGLQQYRTQADIYVAARSKGEAFTFLAKVGLAPSRVGDPEFRVASGTPVEALIAAGAMTEGAVVALKPNSANTPAVWVSDDVTGTCQFGEFVRGEFVPDADLVAGGGIDASPITEAELNAQVPDDPSSLTKPADPSYPEEGELLLARLNSSSRQLPRIEAELSRARAERAALCLRAVELGLVDEAARELGVTPARVYQLKDKVAEHRH